MKQALSVRFNKERFLTQYAHYGAEIEEVINAALPLFQPLGYVVESEVLAGEQPVEMGSSANASEIPATTDDAPTTNDTPPNRDDTPAIKLNCIVTLGRGYESLKQLYLQTGDVLKDYFLDQICDLVLFQATSELYSLLRKQYQQKGMHLSYRQSYENDEIIEQKYILEVVQQAHPDIDMTISEGYMYSPVKSIGYRYFASPAIQDSGIDQNCDYCSNIQCTSRVVNVLLYTEVDALGQPVPASRQVLTAPYKSNLLDMLRSADADFEAHTPLEGASVGADTAPSSGLEIHADCGGKGTCGACKVKIVGAIKAYPPTAQEQKLLSPSELEEGIRLACLHRVNRTTAVLLNQKKPSSSGIVHDFDPAHLPTTGGASSENSPYSFAIDIGTTTLVVALVDATGHIVDRLGATNPQKAFGADVMSRIAHANSKGHLELTSLIRGKLSHMINQLYTRWHPKPDATTPPSGLSNPPTQPSTRPAVEQIVISGNTTMIYLLLGENPKPLGESPYKARETGAITIPATKLFRLDFTVTPDNDPDSVAKERGREAGGFANDFAEATSRPEAPDGVTIIPWLSAFVGGDIVSGIYFANLLSDAGTLGSVGVLDNTASSSNPKSPKVALLLDIGTNGEIALVKKGQLYTTSTAAGPAFEGANIRMGMGVVEGAISKVTKEGFTTIGNVEPTGICGTGIIDALALALENGIVDATGRLEEPIALTEKVKLYPEDIRQIQLAKGSIAAGIRTLLETTNTACSEVEALYISGGFGMYLNKEHALAIGLIPKELGPAIRVLGNSSLGGCIRFIIEGKHKGVADFAKIQGCTTTVDLSSNPIFHTHYMNEMLFLGVPCRAFAPQVR